MNKKDALKRLRRIAEATAKQPDGLVPMATNRVVGTRLPDGFLRERFDRLAKAPGAWLGELIGLVKPVYAQILVNRPGSARGIYRHLKKRWMRKYG